MILRQVTARNRFISAWMVDDICVTSAVCDLTTNTERYVDVVTGKTRQELLDVGFTDMSILDLMEEIKTKFTGGKW